MKCGRSAGCATLALNCIRTITPWLDRQMSARKGGKRTETGTLNLGFADLLGSEEPQFHGTIAVPAEPKPEAAPAMPATVEPGSPLLSSLLPQDSDYHAALAAGNWEVLASLSEERLGVEEKDPTARFCWVLSQLELGALPAVLLTPSFESAAAAPTLPQALYRHVHAKLSAALSSAGEAELAASLSPASAAPDDAPVVVTRPVDSTQAIGTLSGAARRYRTYALIGASVVASLALVIAPWDTAARGIAVAHLVEAIPAAPVRIPAPPKLQLPSQLSALMYEMERATPIRSDAAPQNSEAAIAPLTAIEISTSSPLEPPQITALRRGEVHSTANKTAGSSHPTLHKQSGREVNSQSRDLFGDEKARELANAREISVVQNFSRLRIYVVPSGAPVFSAASREGAVLEELPAGSKVHVDGRSGEWLRLVSKSGRTGFIRSGDAEIFDPDQHTRS